jgi:hypothetical protein
VMPGWSHSSEIPEVSNSAWYFRGDLPGIFAQNPVSFEQTGVYRLLIWWSAPKGASAFHIMMQPTKATWNLTTRT